MSLEEKEDKREQKMEKPSKKLYIIMAAVLVVGVAIGSAFGGLVDVAGWFGNGEPEEVGQVGEMDDFEEVKPQLEQEMRQEKEQEVIMQHLDELREASDIETNLDVIGEGDESAAVATVNNEEITKEEFLEVEEQEKQQLMMMGMDPESEEAEQMMGEMRPQILENLIANTVLMQRVEEEGIEVSEEDVEDQYQQYVEQVGGEEMLEQQMEQAGMTKEDFRQEIAENLPVQIYVESYLEENLDEEELEFTEEELRERYEEQQQQMEQQQEQPIEIEPEEG